jgi:hypothetical protein
MTLPFTLPDWLPWWSVLVVLVPVLIYLLAFLAMPFSTIGVKARLDQLDARFDELQDEIRAMPHRMPPERGPQRAPETRESVSRGAGFRAPETREFELPRVEQDRSDYDAVVDVPPEAPVAPPAYRPTLLPRMDLSPDGGSRSGQPSPVAPDRSFRSPAPSDPPRRPPPRRDDPSGRAEPRIEWPR